MEPRIFLLGPPKCKLPKIGRKLERKCKGEKVLPFWTTLSPCATGFFFFWLCRFFRFCLLLELLLNSSHSFLFFTSFSICFGFFFHLFFPLICFVLLYFIIFYKVTIHTQFFNKNNNMLLFVYLITE